MWPGALDAGLGALAALGGALIVVERTFGRKIDDVCSAHGLTSAGDALERLSGRITAAIRTERGLAEAATRADAENRARHVEAEARAGAERARRTLVRSVASALKALAEGDLTVGVSEPELAREFDAAVALYGKTLFALASSAAAIRARAQEITADAEALADRAQAETRRLAPAREALGQVAQRNDASARAAREAELLFVETRATTERAAVALAAGATTLDRLGDERARVTEIADRLEGFAFQTRLIALNAGVEAARAGEAGRGVTVVAQELRALSERTAEATRELSAAFSDTAAESRARAKSLREAAEEARRFAATLSAVGVRPALEPEDPLRAVEAALDAAAVAAEQDARAGAEVSAASRSLEALVAKLAALAGHFRFPGAESFAADVSTQARPRLTPEPRALPAPRAAAGPRSAPPAASRRLRAG